MYGDKDKDQNDNSGDITPNTDGGVSIGIGGGLAIDLSDGSLGINVGGVVIDF